jgi:PilZ domain
VVIYPGGAVLTLCAAVDLGQVLLLVNPQNNVRAVCRVAAFESPKNATQPQVTLGFTKPAAKFWGVAFPPEKGDSVERKLPRLTRRSRRVESSQPIEVCRTGESGADVKDVCITQNLSRHGLYFTTEQTGYQEEMPLTISFLNHSDLFASNASYAAHIVRVDRMADGRVGVAVKLLGSVAKACAAASSQRKAVSTRTGHGLAVIRGDSRSPQTADIRVIHWPVPDFSRIEQFAAKRAKTLVRLGRSTGKLCAVIAVELHKRSGELGRSVSALARVALSSGKRAAIQLAERSSEGIRQLEKHAFRMATLLRARVLGLRPLISWTRSWLQETAKKTVLGATRIRTAFTPPKDDGLHEFGSADFHDESL